MASLEGLMEAIVPLQNLYGLIAIFHLISLEAQIALALDIVIGIAHPPLPSQRWRGARHDNSSTLR